jgi:hypothetical protein
MPRYTGHVNLSFSTGQIDDLRAGREQVFVDEMAAHLSALAPRHAQAMGPDAMRAFVRAAIDRSSAFGVLERDTTRVWLELSMLWGIGFADDPTYAFVRRWLDDPVLPELQRIRMLHRAATAYCRAACGSDGAAFKAAVSRFAAARPAADLVIDPYGLGQLLARVWPERAEQVGGQALSALAFGSISVAQALGADDGGVGRAAAAGLVFMLGADCLHDPQYQWFFTHLPADGTRIERGRALLNRAQAYARMAATHA